MSDQREWIDIIDWTTLTGVLAACPSGYLWFCLAVFKLSNRACPFNPIVLLFCILGSIPLSAVSAIYGSRLWWLVTALGIGTLLFVGFRLH